MSKAHKVIDIERNLFEGLPLFTMPPAVDEGEISLRREGGPGSAGRRAEHTALLRFMNILKLIPVTELRAIKMVTNKGAQSLIGSGVLGLFPEEAVGLTPLSEDARMRKPARLPDLRSRDLWDPSQRPTANDIIDMSIDKLGVAAAMAENLIDFGSKTEEEIRQRMIDLGRLEASIGMDLSCWQLADSLAYADTFPSSFETMHLVREEGIAQKKGAVALAGQIQVVPSARQWAVDHTNFLGTLYNAGIPAVTHALHATAHLTAPS